MFLADDTKKAIQEKENRIKEFFKKEGVDSYMLAFIIPDPDSLDKSIIARLANNGQKIIEGVINQEGELDI